MASDKPTGGWRTIATLAFTAAAVFAFGSLGFALAALGARLTLPWLAQGMAVAAIVRGGRRLWPAVLLGALGANLLAHQRIVYATAASAGLTLGALLADALLRARDFRPSFERRANVTGFVLMMPLAMILPPSVALLTDLVTGHLGDWNLPVDWLRWWLNDTISVLLLAPLFLALSTTTLRELLKGRTETFAWCTGLALAFLVIVGFLPLPSSQLAMLVSSVLLVVWSALRFGLAVSSFGAMVLFSGAAISAAFGSGLLGGLPVLPALIALWSYSATLAVLSLMITVLLRERAELALALQRSERRYHELFDANPHAVYVFDDETLKFLFVNPAAQRRYGYTREELIRMSIADIRSPEDLPLLRSALEFIRRTGSHASRVPGDWRHRTSDGRFLEVEVTRSAIHYAGRPATLIYAIDVSDQRRLQRALLELSNGEQRRLGQELHDGLGQELTALAIHARGLAVDADQQGSALAPELARLAEVATQAIKSCRAIARGLSPLSETRGGLVEALRDLVDRAAASTRAKVRIITEELAPLAIAAEGRNHIYRIAQEALANAIAHAQAENIELALRIDGAAVHLAVRDDGRGLGAASLETDGIGLETMRYRAAIIHGTLVLRAREAGGTELCLDCPQPAASTVA
jgi:PAS domain S-box-containing protein